MQNITESKTLKFLEHALGFLLCTLYEMLVKIDVNIKNPLKANKQLSKITDKC